MPTDLQNQKKVSTSNPSLIIASLKLLEAPQGLTKELGSPELSNMKDRKVFTNMNQTHLNKVP